MTKVTIELTPEQALVVLQALTGAKSAAPAPAAHAPAPHAPAPAAPAAYAPPPGAPAAPAPAAPAAVASGFTQAQVAGAAQAYSKTHGPKAAKAKLAEFGLTKISDANPAVYPQLMQALAV